MTSLTIPNSVTLIDEAAFFGCESLTSLILGNKVSSLGNNAFHWCNKLKSVTSLNKTAPTLGNSSFHHVEGAILKVPQNCVVSYINAGYLNYFENIEEIDPTGIQGVALDKKSNAPVYDLNGKKLKDPRKGVNIIDGKKVVAK